MRRLYLFYITSNLLGLVICFILHLLDYGNCYILFNLNQAWNGVLLNQLVWLFIS